MRKITIEPLTEAAFAPFGDILDTRSVAPVMINQGRCARFSDLARTETDAAGKIGISVFEAEGYALPLTLEMMERHPLASQAFLPMTHDPFVVIVAPDADGAPGQPLAFLTAPGQGVNYHRATWHGVVTPLSASRFFVVDRIGPGANLEEHWFQKPYVVHRPASE